MIRFLIFFASLFICTAFVNTINRVSNRFTLRLLAKKKRNNSNKGFAKTTKPESADIVSPTTADIAITKGTDAIKQPIEPAANDVDAIFRKYGMDDEVTADKKRAEAQKVEDPLQRPFGSEVMAGIPAKTQLQYENVLMTGAFGSLAFCVLCGIGISLGAFKLVFPDIDVPSQVEELIKNVLDPAFTPSIFIFFFFSITLGIFKFAQISSEATVYRE